MNTRITVKHTGTHIQLVFSDQSPDDPQTIISKARDLTIPQALMVSAALINEVTALLVEISKRNTKKPETPKGDEPSEGNTEATA